MSEHGVGATGIDVDTLDPVVGGKGDLFAIDLQRRVGHARKRRRRRKDQRALSPELASFVPDSVARLTSTWWSFCRVIRES